MIDHQGQTICVKPYVTLTQALSASPMGKPTVSFAVQGPEWRTEWAGISPSSVGIWSTVVSVGPG